MIEPFKNKIYITRPLLANLDELNNKLDEIWSSQWLTNNGPQHQLLENKLKKVLKVPEISLFNNGTIALMIAFQALKLKGEVITTPFTFPATPNVLVWNNLKPVFCDIDPINMTIDANKIESLITPDTTAILGVHVYGTPCDVFKIHEIADKHNLKVVYDAAHAFETEISERGIGTFGDISMFSFHATKLFHTLEGGALTCNDPKIKRRIDLLKNFGIENEDNVIEPGINGKMNEIQAAVGLINLNIMEEEREKRSKLVSTYKSLLNDIEGITFLELDKNTTNSYQYFVVRVNEKILGKSRDYFYNEFKKYNVFTRKYFFPLCSDYPYFKNLPSSSISNLPIANSIVKEVLTLPLYGSLKIEEVEKICSILKEIKESK